MLSPSLTWTPGSSADGAAKPLLENKHSDNIEHVQSSQESSTSHNPMVKRVVPATATGSGEPQQAQASWGAAGAETALLDSGVGEELDCLETWLVSTTSELAAVLDKLRVVETRNKSLEEQNRDLRGDQAALHEALAKHNDMISELAGTTSEVQELRKRVSILDTDLTRHQSALKSRSADLQEARQARTEVEASFKEAAHELQKERSKSAAQSEQLMRLTMDKRALEEKLNRLTSAHAQQMEITRAEQERALAAQRAELEARLATLTSGGAAQSLLSPGRQLTLASYSATATPAPTDQSHGKPRSDEQAAAATAAAAETEELIRQLRERNHRKDRKLRALALENERLKKTGADEAAAAASGTPAGSTTTTRKRRTAGLKRTRNGTASSSSRNMAGTSSAKTKVNARHHPRSGPLDFRTTDEFDDFELQ